jgi:DNA-binding response OmpR family regulator
MVWVAADGGQTDGENGSVLDGAAILIVEDEFIIAADLQDQFESEGATVVGPCPTLATALVCARRDQITAAVLDMRLGRDSTDPVARVLSERGIPFLFYSGQSDSTTIKLAWPRAMLVSKPASGRAVINAVRWMIDFGGS